MTAVVPYFGYARQDRRTATGQALGSAVVANAIADAGADRLVVVDPHTPALESQCRIPVEILTAVPTLSGELAPGLPAGSVVVAPDLGAVKLAERYVGILHGPVAVVRKQRESGATVSALDVAGDVCGRSAVIVDDLITTGATIEAAAGLLRLRGVASDIVVAATHGAVGPRRRQPITRSRSGPCARDRHGGAQGGGHHDRGVSIAPTLAMAIACMHDDKPVEPITGPPRAIGRRPPALLGRGAGTGGFVSNGVVAAMAFR